MYDDFLMHVGVAHDENPPGRGSGRWPYGSGPNAYQRPKDFLERVERLRRQGLTDKKIAEEVGLLNYQGTGDTTALKAQIDLEKHYKRMLAPLALQPTVGRGRQEPLRDRKIFW